MLPKLHFISQGTSVEDQYNSIQQAIQSGCSWVQLRVKNQPPEVVLELAKAVKSLCVESKVLLTINDSIEIARIVNADGVHLGLTDDSVSKARTILGNNCIIGGTANTLQDVIQRHNEGCNYVGLGPLRSTPTKEKLSPILDFSGYASIFEELKKRSVSLPVFAIGGVQLEDIQQLIDSGAYGIAVSSALIHHSTPNTITNEFNAI